MIKLYEFLDDLNEETKYTSISGQFPHKHKYKIDDSGSGITTIVNGGGPEHKHQINQFVVGKAGNDGHTHEIEEKGNGPEEADRSIR